MYHTYIITTLQEDEMAIEAMPQLFDPHNNHAR